MNYLIGFVLVFAGMLFGYMLWFRDRSEDEELRQKLARENDDLRLSLKIAHNSHAKLDERFTRQQGQLHVLQQLCDDWSQSREQAERERAEIEVLSSSNAERLEETKAELQQERQRRVELEDQHHQATQSHLQEIAGVESEFRKRVAKLESSVSQKSGKVETLETDNQRLKEQLTQSEARLAELKADLKSQQQLLEVASQNQDGLKQEYVSLETALKSSSDELKEVRSAHATATTEKKQAEEALATLREEHERLKKEAGQLADRVADYDSVVAQTQTLQQALQNSAEQLALVVRQRDSSLDSESAQRNVIVGLKKRLDNQEATILRLRRKHDDTLETLKSELDAKSALEVSLEESNARFEELEERQFSAVQTHSEALIQLTKQRDGFADQLEEVQSEVAGMLASHTEAIQQLTAQRDQFADRLKAAEAEMVELVERHQLKIDELVVEGNQTREHLNAAQRDGEKLAEQCDEIAAVCTNLEAELATEKSKRASAEQQNQSLRVEIQDHVNRFSQFELDQASIRQSSGALEELQHELAQQAERFTMVDGERLELSRQIEQVTEQRDALLNELASSRQAHVETQELFQQADARVTELTGQVDELEIKCQRITELEALVKERSLIDRQSADEVRVLREQYAEAFAERESLREQVASLSSQRESRELESEQRLNDVKTLQTKLKASEETIRNLRRERAAVLARLANYRTVAEPDATVISFTEAMAIRAKSELDYDAEYGGPVRTHATRGVVYTEPPKEVDDLKRISGIAEVLEARLNDYGIYTFKQIKDWSPEAIEEFSHLLAFRDRISRDDWVGQASQFYREKQRTPKTYAA